MTRFVTWLGSLGVVVFVLVGLNAADMLLVAFGNITDYGTNYAFVQHVLSMDTTNFGQKEGADLDPDVMWRAIDNPVLWNIGYIAIIAAELIAGLVCVAALVLWTRRRDAVAKSTASIGLLLIVLIFMGGFIVVGGEWFQMWRSTAWNGEDSALRNVLLAGIALVLLHLPRGAVGAREITAE